jgi:RNA-directed DNA polymerase
MNFEQYKIEFSKIASSSGYTEQNIQKCINYVEPLFLNDVPVIYNTSNLSALVGYKKEYLKKAVKYTSYYYRDFEILKKNGKKRKISEPLPSLKEIQIWILENILYKIKVSPYAKAYKPKVGLMENLRFHKKQPKVFTIDLENFFPSIKLKSIETIFLNLGYSIYVSSLLAKLCCRENSLPQGAPTSPYLSNIFLKNADEQISIYCKENKIRFTRYADDLTFSGDFDENKLLEFVTEIFNSKELKINESKLKLMTPNLRQIVTGIVVNEKPQVVFHKRNELRQSLYFIKKFGFDEHVKHKEIKKANYLEHLLGKVNFVLQINPKDEEFKKYKTHLIEIKKIRDQNN